MTQDKVIFDVWGGDLSQILYARKVLYLKEALARAEAELKKGFLVNLRVERNWQSFEEFDLRN